MTLTEFYGLTIINFILLRAFFDEQGPSSSLEDTTAISKSSSLPTRWKRFVELIEGWSDFGFFECRAVPAFLLFLPLSGVKKTSCHPAEGWGSATELTRELLWVVLTEVEHALPISEKVEMYGGEKVIRQVLHEMLTNLSWAHASNFFHQQWFLRWTFIFHFPLMIKCLATRFCFCLTFLLDSLNLNPIFNFNPVHPKEIVKYLESDTILTLKLNPNYS